MSLAFVPGFPTNSPQFLGRFLSPVAGGVAAHYIRNLTRPGDIVFDPFGQSPSVAVEALSLDRRVIVASINPILRLALSLAVRPPALSELKAALTALGDAPVGPGASDRLEAQIKTIYATDCAECHARTVADAFDWDAETGELVEKHYVCLACGGPRSAPPDDDDRARAVRFARSGPDYHFLLGRTADPEDPDPSRAEETLAIYPARTLAAIGMALHKFDTLDLERDTRRWLAGLLVAAFDATTTLAQERPKVLAVPRRYREVNFWLALESGLGLLAGTPMPDRSATLEALLANTERPAIYSHAGSVRELAARLPEGACALLLTAPPRPNQAFWTLSAAWAAWLWGREAVDALRATLHRRRYDWTWHARALHQALASARPALAADGRLVCLVADAEPGLDASLVAAAAGAGYRLQAGALRADTAEAQLDFAPGPPAVTNTSDADVSRAARDAARALIEARGEPTHWSSVQFAAWCRVAADGLIGWNADEPLARVNAGLQRAIGDASQLKHLSEAIGDDPSTGLWFLARPELAAEAGLSHPLADRVEAEVIRRLTSDEPLDEHDLLRDVCAAFPGPLTPGRGLVMACLNSYAAQGDSGLWRLRPEDSPTARSSELQSILAELRALASRQGYEATATNPQEWRDDGQTVYLFTVLSSAVIARHLLGPQRPARRKFLVLPGGRAGLVEHKLRRDPRLRQAIGAGEWAIVKFRQVRRMLAEPGLTRATLEPALAGDPLDALRQMSLPS